MPAIYPNFLRFVLGRGGPQSCWAARGFGAAINTGVRIAGISAGSVRQQALLLLGELLLGEDPRIAQGRQLT